MKKKAKRSFIFNIEWQEVLMEYPTEVRLEVYDAIIEYAASGTLSELKPLAKMAFSFIKKEIDSNNAKYDETVKKRSEAGKKGMSSRYGRMETAGGDTGGKSDNGTPDAQGSVTNGNKANTCYQDVTNLTNVTDNVYVYDSDIKEKTSNEVKKKTGKFIPPSMEEVIGYIREKGYNVDAEKFINFYESKGWYVGKNKMKNWHAAIATWEKTENEHNNGNQNRNPYWGKQEANDYALHALQERMERRSGGIQDEIPKPF